MTQHMRILVYRAVAIAALTVTLATTATAQSEKIVYSFTVAATGETRTVV